MSNASWSRSTAVAVVAVSVLLGFAVGAALWWGSQNLLMGATIGGILALLFGGFAVAAMRGSASGTRRSGGTDAGAVVLGGHHDHTDGGHDGGAGVDGGGGGADGG